MKAVLPFPFKIFGLFLLVLASVLTFVYFYYGLRIVLPVFAIVSVFLETKICTFFETNFSEELIMLSCLLGLSFISFSKEKQEIKIYDEIRIKALQKTSLIYVLWCIITIVFFYGNAFAGLMLFNTVSFFILYISIFYFLKKRTTKNDIFQK